MSSPSTTVLYNGEPLDIPAGSTISDLLRHHEVRTSLVAVEVNLAIVPQQLHAQTVLAEGDQVEVVTLVGGG